MSDSPSESPEAARTPQRPKRSRRPSRRLFVSAVVVVILGALIVPTRRAVDSLCAIQCHENLKRIWLGLQNYHDVHEEFPPAYTVDNDGRKLHSWRTLILPFIDRHDLYDKMDLSKLWDDPANADVVATDIPEYRCPSAWVSSGHTSYCAVVTPDSCLRPIRSIHLRDIKDGSSGTLMFLEVSRKRARRWAEPWDLDETTLLEIHSAEEFTHLSGSQFKLVDGTVWNLTAEIRPSQLRALITVAAGDDARGALVR